MFELFLKRFAIPCAVFITGACVLVIEIIAVRILSPYYGNTIFTISSVISVVLLALSAGYYIGGKIADRFPKEIFFYGIIFASGVSVIVLHLIGMVFLASFGYQLSIINGPLISSLVLFFLQSFLLGTLSPFAIKLQATRMEKTGIGSVAGEIFFFSTLGSIAGSLSAGFLLIPHVGVDKIMLGAGFLLISLGLAGVLRINPWAKSLVIIFFFGQIFFSSLSPDVPNAVFAKDSLYQKITIREGTYLERPARFLTQDRNLSAAQFLDGDDLVYEYTKYYRLYEVTNPHIQNALAIGGGAYSIPKALLKDSPNIQVDVAEIDPLIFDLGKEYFGVPDDPRLRNFAQDGRKFLHTINKKYDLIFSDAYSSLYSTPEHLTTREFFTLAKEKLTANGVFIANVVGDLSQTPESFALSEMRTFKNVFNNSYFFAVNAPDSDKMQNLIFVGYSGNTLVNFNDPKITQHENDIIGNLPKKLIDLGNLNLSQYPLLTDNFAPVDYLISKEFQNLH